MVGVIIMNQLSYEEFMKKVKEQISEYSIDDFHNIIYDVWGDNIKKSIYVMEQEYVEKYQKFAIEQLKKVSFDITEQKYYTNWCQKEVDGI